MVHDIPQKPFTAFHSYEEADGIAERCARILMHRWAKSMRSIKDREQKILSRLKQIADYFEVTAEDEYLSNLYLILIGTRSEGKPISIALERMEKVRILILDVMTAKNKNGIPTTELTQYIYDKNPATKLKYLMRFAIAKYTAWFLYEKLKTERQKNKKRKLSENPEFNGSPDKFLYKLNEFLKNYR